MGKNQYPHPVSGSGLNILDHLSDSLETIFRVKILKFSDSDPGSGTNIPAPQHCLLGCFLGWGGACESFESSVVTYRLKSVKVMQCINPVLHTLNYTDNWGAELQTMNAAENILGYFFQGRQQILWHLS
jgi:hypothetical protein